MLTQIPLESSSDMSLLGLASCLARLSLPVLFVELVKIVIDIILTVVLMVTHNLAECLDVLWIILDAAVSFLTQPVFPTLWDELWVIDIGDSRLSILLRMNEVVRAGIDDVDGGSIRACSIHLYALLATDVVKLLIGDLQQLNHLVHLPRVIPSV